MRIMLNPDLWTVASARPDGKTDRVHGEVFDVSDEDWEVLRERKSRQFGNSYRTWMQAGETAPAPERMWIRDHELGNLTLAELKEQAEARDLSKSGNKTDLIERILAHESDGEPV